MTENSRFVMFYPGAGLDRLNPGFSAAKLVKSESEMTSGFAVS